MEACHPLKSQKTSIAIREGLQPLHRQLRYAWYPPQQNPLHLKHSFQSISGQQNTNISNFFNIVTGIGVGGLFAAMLFSSFPFSTNDIWLFLAKKAHHFLKKPSPSFLARVFCGGGNGKGDEGDVWEEDDLARHREVGFDPML